MQGVRRNQQQAPTLAFPSRMPQQLVMIEPCFNLRNTLPVANECHHHQNKPTLREIVLQGLVAEVASSMLKLENEESVCTYSFNSFHR